MGTAATAASSRGGRARGGEAEPKDCGSVGNGAAAYGAESEARPFLTHSHIGVHMGNIHKVHLRQWWRRCFPFLLLPNREALARASFQLAVMANAAGRMIGYHLFVKPSQLARSWGALLHYLFLLFLKLGQTCNAQLRHNAQAEAGVFDDGDYFEEEEDFSSSDGDEVGALTLSRSSRRRTTGVTNNVPTATATDGGRIYKGRSRRR